MNKSEVGVLFLHMAPHLAAPVGGTHEGYEGHTTIYVLLTSILAASGGLMFGYDIGISGGVMAMTDFQEKFFPDVLYKKQHAQESEYCKYNDQRLQAFTSSLYIAGLVSTFSASWVTRKHGRKMTMLIGGLTFLAGVALSSGAENVAMLIIGRLFMGWGVGFANQGVPLYLSEMAPAKWRGGLNILFQLAITIGILFANLINYTANKFIHHVGWRIALAIAGVPALLLTLGGLILPDTPASLIQRGDEVQGRKVLEKIRGTTQVHREFRDLVQSSIEVQVLLAESNPFQNILKRRNRPQLVIALLLQLFQQFTGINAVMFYAPVLFQTLGFKSDASLYSAVITGAVNVLSTVVSIVAVDRLGRRFLLLQAGFQMFLAQAGIGIILAIYMKEGQQLAQVQTIVVVILICLYVASFAWSWGPLGWLIPSEIFSFDTRSAGQSMTVSTNLVFTFLIAQCFLSMLCSMKWAIFLFFASCVALMQAFVFYFVPETKGVAIEDMGLVWRSHWFWKRFVPSTVQAAANSRPPFDAKLGFDSYQISRSEILNPEKKENCG